MRTESKKPVPYAGPSHCCSAVPMQKLCHIVACIIWLICCLALAMESSPIFAFLFFVPFSLFPHAITHAMISKTSTIPALAVLMVCQIGYVSWFLYIYIQAFHIYLDAQSPIALLFAGIYSLPVMVPLWIAAAVLSRLTSPAQQGDSKGTPPRGTPDL